jgi:hypothetical protein
MKTSLHRHIDPANYHPDAVASAAGGTVTTLTPLLLILRLSLELHKEDYAVAKDVLSLLETQNQEGYALFQIKTAALILALQSATGSTVVAALEDWLEARKIYPENFTNDVWAAPELTPFVASFDAEKLAVPVPERYVVTEADRAMVADLSTAREMAVTENTEWLAPMGVTGSVKSIAKAYHIVHANHHLREITLGNDKDWPELIVSVDKNGAFIGSFISH